ncbi:MAG: gamma-glutamyltransferase family protein [Opitutaceae bacterium]|nr:gamma-glutamyltransferase family protein [Opitutaceae bacterium]
MSFDWSNPYPSTRSPLFARNVVATSHPLAAQAGLRILQRGGNAIDAAIATAAAITIVEPVANGIGSDNFALVWDGAKLHGLNSSGVAPAAWNPEYFAKKYNGVLPRRGWDSVTVPGAVAGWVALHERFGSLPFADLFETAIDLADRGHLITPHISHKWSAQVAALRGQPGFAETFLPGGRAPRPGETFVFKDAATTLRRIAETRGEAFYRGELAEKLVAHAREHGGALTRGDLAGFSAEWVEPISKAFAGYTVHEIPPNGQGIAALIALGILDRIDLKGLRLDSVESHHVQIEAMKLAFADVYRWVADGRSMNDVTAAELLDNNYIADRARLIRLDRATAFEHGTPPRGGTIFLSVADAKGRMVSLIQSNFAGFGSGVVVPGTGISLQNRGSGFSLDPRHPNVVAGGKRPFHTIIPGFVTKDGKAQLSFGVVGGPMQPQGHVQTLARLLIHGQQPQAACDAPRWKVERGLQVGFESAFPARVRDGLLALGHQLETTMDPDMAFGSAQLIWKLSDGPDAAYVAASDPRRDGVAVGF